VNDGVSITDNSGAFNSGGIQLYGETGSGYTFDDITISGNTFTDMVNADPNSVMQRLFGSSYDQFMSPITISLQDGVATGSDIVISDNTIDMPMDQISGQWDQSHAIQVRGDVTGLTVSDNVIDFTDSGLQVKATDNDMATWDDASGYAGLVGDAIFLIGDISGAIVIDSNSIDKTTTADIELQGIVIEKSHSDYGSMVTADITSLAITDTVVSDQFRYAAASRTTESVDLTDLELILNTPGDLAGEKLTVTSNTIESAVLKNMTVAEVTNYMADMVNVDAIVASDTSGFTFGTDQLSVAEMIGLTELGYNDFADAGTAIPSTLAEGSLYYMDGTDQLSTVQDNAFSVVVSDEVIDGAATTRVTLTYDSNPVVGTTHYHSRILDFAGSSTSGNPGLASEWLSEGVVDYGNLLLNSPAAITSANTATIAEDAAAGAAVLTVTATDGEGDTIAYSLDATSLNTFDIDSATGAITLKSGVSLDHETTDSYTVTVSATDDGSNVATSQTLTVSVGDVNEAPTVTSGATGTDVSDGAAAGTTVYTTTGSDVDSGTTLSYSLGGTDASSFAIDSATGVVTLASAADYDTKSSYSFTVTATDDGTGTLSSDPQTVTLSVTPNLIQLTAETVTALDAVTAINPTIASSFTTGTTETYVKLTITLDANALDSSYSGSGLDGIQGELVLSQDDFEVISPYAKNASSATADADVGIGYVTNGNLTLNDDTTSGQFGDFTNGTTSFFVDLSDSTVLIPESSNVAVLYLNPADDATSVDIGIENAYATEGSTQYTQSDYSITVDIV